MDSQEKIQIITTTKQLLEECDYEKAEQNLKPLFKSDPENTEILDLLGEIYLNISNFKEAKKMLEKSIQLNPDINPDKYMDYAQVLENPFLRVESYKKAIELYKKNNINSNEIKEKIASAFSSIASLYMTTDLCDDPNAENICENSISEALNIFPESIEALLQLSNLRILRKKDNEAQNAMYKILEKLKNIENNKERDDTLPERDVLINLSQNFAELKLFKDAIYVINLILNKDDEDIESYYLLSIYEDEYRNFNSAMDALEKFNNLYMKLQKNGGVTPVIQQYVESAKSLYSKLSKIKKEELIDEHIDEEEQEDVEDEDEEMR